MNQKKNVLIITNSTFGKRSNIGYRAYQIKKNASIDYNIYVFARGSRKKDKDVIDVYPMGDLIPRFLSFIRYFIWPSFKYKKLDHKLFNYFLKEKLKKNPIHKFDIIHLWENDISIYKTIKKFSDLIILDIAIMGEIDTSKKEEIIQNTPISYVDFITVPSKFIKSNLEKAFPRINSKVFVNYFGVNFDFNFQKKYNSSKLIFLFVGHVHKRKGVLELLEAWKKFSPSKNETLILCGRPTKDILRIIKKEQLINLQIMGFVDPEYYYQNSSVFILPSKKEGSAKAIFEAMNYNLPIITTENAGSIVNSNKEGLIIPHSCPNSIYNAMKYFREFPEEIIRMGNNAKQKVKYFTWEKYGLRANKVYRNFLNGKS